MNRKLRSLFKILAINIILIFVVLYFFELYLKYNDPGRQLPFNGLKGEIQYT